MTTNNRKLENVIAKYNAQYMRARLYTYFNELTRRGKSEQRAIEIIEAELAAQFNVKAWGA